MRYVLGFDGGGTKTDCVLMDEARQILAQSQAGPSNPLRVGFGAALASLREAARVAMEQAHIGRGEIAALCAGLAGTGRSDATEKMRSLLAAEFPGVSLCVCTDLQLVIESAGDGPAIVLVAGTGSAAIGRNQDGAIARVGGHGPLLGDEGSAYDIGRRAIVAALRIHDRSGTDSALGKGILLELGCASWAEVYDRANAAADEVFPHIFPVIAAAADAGDETARGLLRAAAYELAALVDALAERLDFRGTSFLLAKTGGMIGRTKYLDAQLDERLRIVAPQAQMGPLQRTPAEAAAGMALQLIAHGQPAGK
jgi:N-acetylglucosamine kinase-like BadF-type ATPase